MMAPVAVVAPLALAWLFPLAAVAALALGGHRDLRHLASFYPLVALLGLLCLWALVSVLWSIAPTRSLQTGAQISAVSVAGLVISAVANDLETSERARVRRAFLIGFLTAFSILALGAAAHFLWPWPQGSVLAEWLRGYARLNRGATTIALAVWPAALALRAMDRRRLAVLLPLATLAVLLGLVDQSALLSVVVGIATFVCAWWLPRLTASAIFAGVLALVVLLPLTPLDLPEIAQLHERLPSLKVSGLHRLVIWHFVSERIAERPLLGWGLDASSAIPGGAAVIDYPGLSVLSELHGQWLPLHPHNAALQWRLELGIPGALLLTLVIGWMLQRASGSALARDERALALALIASGLVVAMLSYGFWQAWWQASLWLTAAAVPAVARSGPRSRAGIEH